MDGQKPVLQALGLALMVATLAFALPVQAAGEANARSSEETIRNGRVIGVLTSPDDTYERTWSLRQGEWTSLSIDCGQCTVTLEIDGVSIDVTSSATVQAGEDGTARMTVSSSVQEFVSYSLIESIDEQHPTVRPSPGESMPFSDPWICEPMQCSNLTQGLDALPSTEFHSNEFLVGVLDMGQAEYIAVPVVAGSTMELQLLHSTSNIEVEEFMQSANETLLEQKMTQDQPTMVNERQDSLYWYAEQQGRMILKVSSDSPNTAYSLKRTLHSPMAGTQMIDVTTAVIVEGHHLKTVLIETTETKLLMVQSLHSNTSGTLEQLVSGQWLSSTPVHFSFNEPSQLYPYPNASAFRLNFEGERFALELNMQSFDDIASNLEAPSLRPSSQSMNNSSWPLLMTPSDPMSGELTLAIHDTADVYKLEMEGYEESIHLVQIKVMSEDLHLLQLEMWDLDQETWEVVDSRLVTQVNGKVQTALELTRGTHYVRVSHIDATNATNHTRGDAIDPLNYMISAAYTMIDEGDEPYFPPDESTVMWGEVARWVMGMLFLAPCAYFAMAFASNRRLARELSEKTEQLAWFQSQMDKGEKAPLVLRKSLDKSLQAIAQLDWATACTTWGAMDAEHRTEGIAMAVWKLDSRLAKTEGAHPIMVGIHVIEGQWELAALRFDAPEGQAWEVVNVEPKFLHRGEEIFVDTMRPGNLTFLTLELKGNAGNVDVELNGRCNGEATAARIPQTLSLSALEEE